nr:MAG TPA: hypothetical protein [Caudoviricetes sp.]
MITCLLTTGVICKSPVIDIDRTYSPIHYNNI